MEHFSLPKSVLICENLYRHFENETLKIFTKIRILNLFSFNLLPEE